MSGKERDEFYKLDRYRNVDEYDAVLRWHCRLDEPKPKAADGSAETAGSAGLDGGIAMRTAISRFSGSLARPESRGAVT
jgi:hypothetical protein